MSVNVHVEQVSDQTELCYRPFWKERKCEKSSFLSFYIKLGDKLPNNLWNTYKSVSG